MKLCASTMLLACMAGSSLATPLRQVKEASQVKQRDEAAPEASMKHMALMAESNRLDQRDVAAGDKFDNKMNRPDQRDIAAGDKFDNKMDRPDQRDRAANALNSNNMKVTEQSARLDQRDEAATKDDANNYNNKMAQAAPTEEELRDNMIVAFNRLQAAQASNRFDQRDETAVHADNNMAQADSASQQQQLVQAFIEALGKFNVAQKAAAPMGQVVRRDRRAVDGTASSSNTNDDKMAESAAPVSQRDRAFAEALAAHLSQMKNAPMDAKMVDDVVHYVQMKMTAAEAQQQQREQQQREREQREQREQQQREQQNVQRDIDTAMAETMPQDATNRMSAVSADAMC